MFNNQKQKQNPALFEPLLVQTEWQANTNLTLSATEMEVLQLLAKGYRHQQIIEMLYVDLDEVDTAQRSIVFKLKAENINQAIYKARQRGLLN